MMPTNPISASVMKAEKTNTITFAAGGIGGGIISGGAKEVFEGINSCGEN